MPLAITRLINDLPTAEERTAAKQLWNRSLPVSANVGIIEYNRVEGANFREKVEKRHGEGWWRGLEDLAGELNEAALVVVGKENGGELTKLGHPPPLYAHMRGSSPCSAPNLGPQAKLLKQTSPPTPHSVSLIHISALD